MRALFFCFLFSCCSKIYAQAKCYSVVIAIHAPEQSSKNAGLVIFRKNAGSELLLFKSLLINIDEAYPVNFTRAGDYLFRIIVKGYKEVVYKFTIREEDEAVILKKDIWLKKNPTPAKEIIHDTVTLLLAPTMK